MIYRVLVNIFHILSKNYINLHNKILFLSTKIFVQIIKFKKVYIFNTITKLFHLGNFCYSYYNVKLYNPDFNDPTFRYCNGGAYGNFYYYYLKKIKHKFQFIDIGANIGIYSLISSKNSECLKIDSFEPNSKIYNNLKFNLSEINYAYAHNLAISDSVGQLNFYIDPESSGSSKIDKKKFNSTITTINRDFLKKLILRDIKINIKIDVEGHEYLVLNEIMHSFNLDQIYSIYIEIENNEKNYEDIKNLLNGFTLIYTEKLKKKSNCLFEKK